MPRIVIPLMKPIEGLVCKSTTNSYHVLNFLDQKFVKVEDIDDTNVLKPGTFVVAKNGLMNSVDTIKDWNIHTAPVPFVIGEKLFVKIPIITCPQPFEGMEYPEVYTKFDNLTWNSQFGIIANEKFEFWCWDPAYADVEYIESHNDIEEKFCVRHVYTESCYQMEEICRRDAPWNREIFNIKLMLSYAPSTDAIRFNPVKAPMGKVFSGVCVQLCKHRMKNHLRANQSPYEYHSIYNVETGIVRCYSSDCNLGQWYNFVLEKRNTEKADKVILIATQLRAMPVQPIETRASDQHCLFRVKLPLTLDDLEQGFFNAPQLGKVILNKEQVEELKNERQARLKKALLNNSLNSEFIRASIACCLYLVEIEFVGEPSNYLFRTNLYHFERYLW